MSLHRPTLRPPGPGRRHNAAGATAIFENHPLERRFRDMHTMTQQLQARLSHFETVGSWMMGADNDLIFV